MTSSRQKKSFLPVLDVSGVSIHRGKTTILEKISWRVNRGEHWVVLGANGSGKTSLLSALTGYLTPSAGEIELLGQRYGQTDWRELRKQIGLVSSSIRQMMAESEPALDTVASGKYAMIDFWGEPDRADRAAALRILRQIECEYLAERPWAVLSQGERQRVLIGRALMAKPALLILDEPCAGLDSVAREHFLQFVNQLGKSKNAPSLLLVTHHVEEIQPVFSHVLILKAGKLLVAGEKGRVLNSKNLSEAFEATVRLQRNGTGYSLKVSPIRAVVI